MKRTFVIITVAILALVSFLGCRKHEQDATDFLTGTQGWVLSKAFSNPAYYMEDGTYAEDLINDEYLKNFEVAYILIFNTTGGEIVKPGSVVAPSAKDGFITETTLGKWAFDNPDNPSTITMHIPFLYNDGLKGLKDCKILNLSKDELRIRFTVENDEDGMKKTCSFTVTYVPLN